MLSGGNDCGQLMADTAAAPFFSTERATIMVLASGVIFGITGIFTASATALQT